MCIFVKTTYIQSSTESAQKESKNFKSSLDSTVDENVTNMIPSHNAVVQQPLLKRSNAQHLQSSSTIWHRQTNGMVITGYGKGMVGHLFHKLTANSKPGNR